MVGDVYQSTVFHTIEPLIGIRLIQSTKLLPKGAQLQIIQKRKQVTKRLFCIAPAVLTGFETVLSNDAESLSKFLFISAFTHEADAGDKILVTHDQRIQITLQRIPDILLQIRRMAAVTMIEAVRYGNRQANLLGNL